MNDWWVIGVNDQKQLVVECQNTGRKGVVTSPMTKDQLERVLHHANGGSAFRWNDKWGTVLPDAQPIKTVPTDSQTDA